ncbi:hypothetical protein BaRGS_00032835 [Batillaria attramentaria]|uniref:Sulfotransferase domain-containing protein n=1 Tax=Batillaria attramentaria TaxID=370345 RepID=A0ABD0JMD4_9CAEN
MHWLWDIVRMLVNGKAELTTDRMESHLLILSKPDDLDLLPSPRVLATHRQFHELPTDWIIRRRKLVLIVRDAKDVCVSYYNMIRSLKTLDYNGTWDGFLTLFLDGHVPLNSWANWVLSFEKGLKEHPELPVHVVHYEKLKADTLREIQRLAEFLGAPASLAEQVAEQTDFKKMKQHKESVPDPTASLYHEEKSTVFRQGESGQGHKWFTEQQAAEFDKILSERLGRSSLQPLL